MSVCSASFHTVKPLDTQALAEAFARYSVVATVEEHSLIGGFGAAVAEWLVAQPPQRATLCRFGTADEFLHRSGEQEFARHYFGLTAEHICRRIEQAMLRARRSPLTA
jgi:transketolase